MSIRMVSSKVPYFFFENNWFDRIKKHNFYDYFSFFRKGTAGGYRDEMSSEYVKKFDEWQRKHTQ